MIYGVRWVPLGHRDLTRGRDKEDIMSDLNCAFTTDGLISGWYVPMRKFLRKLLGKIDATKQRMVDTAVVKDVNGKEEPIGASIPLVKWITV